MTHEEFDASRIPAVPSQNAGGVVLGCVNLGGHHPASNMIMLEVPVFGINPAVLCHERLRGDETMCAEGRLGVCGAEGGCDDATLAGFCRYEQIQSSSNNDMAGK